MRTTRKIIALMLVATLVMTLFVLPAIASSEHSRAGTTLKVEMTANGSWCKSVEYDWSIEKTVDPTSVLLKKGESASVDYTIKVTRGQPTISELAKVSGSICVNNDGDTETAGLKLQPQVQYKDGGFTDLAGATVTIDPVEQIPAHTVRCYNYTIEFTPVPGVTEYRVLSNVTITNHSGPGESGPNEKANFTLPGGPNTKTIDETAHVYDSVDCPEGLDCTYDPPLTDGWLFEDDGEVSYSMIISNESIDCGQSTEVVNTARLIESDTEQERLSSATVSVDTGKCDEPGDTPGDTPPPPRSYYNPPTPSSRVFSDVIAVPTTPPTIIETSTPAMTVAQEVTTTESTPAREELPYTGMNGLSALLAMALMAGGTFIYRGSKV